MNIEKKINDILTTIKDPLVELEASQLHFKVKPRLENDILHLNLTAGFPVKPLDYSLLPALGEHLAKAFPNYEIKIQLDQFIRAHRTQLAGKGLRGIKNTIAIASGKGGVGKSTVAVNLAIALAKAGARVGLLDADIYGPSIPLMLGQVEPVSIRDNQYIPAHAYGIAAMSIGYLTEHDQALIWRGPMLAKALIQMIDLTYWDELDYLLIDLPPGTGDIQLSLVQKIPLTAAVVVTTPQPVATLDAEKAITMFKKTHIDVLGIIENMSLHTCSQCGHQEAIFGNGGAQKLATASHVPLLGQLPLASQIRSDCDQGRPSAANPDEALALPFTKAAMQMAIRLAAKPLNYADKFPDVIVE